MGNKATVLEKQHSRAKYLVIIFALTLVVFVVDLQLPLGVAAGIPYVAVIITSLWLEQPRYVYLYAVLSTILVVAGFYLSPAGGELWMVIVNRMMAIMTIWITAILVCKWRSSELRLFKHLVDAEKDKERKEIYMATMSGAQHITNNLLNGLKLVEMEIEKHPAFSKDVAELFDGMLVEADALMKKLSSVEDIEAEAIKKSVLPKKPRCG